MENLPQFIEVEGQVEQLQGNALQQNTQIINPHIEANLEITCRTPSSRTVWSYQSGTIEGIVSFHAISDVRSKVLVHLPDTSEGDPKYVGAGCGEMSLRLQNDLERFKVFVER